MEIRLEERTNVWKTTIYTKTLGVIETDKMFSIQLLETSAALVIVKHKSDVRL